MLSLAVSSSYADINDGLLAHWPLDDTTGPVIDSVGTYHGTTFGATRGVPGKIGSAFQFDGVSNYVGTTFGNGVTYPNGLTISLWVKSTDNDNSGLVVGRGAGSGANSQCVGLNAGHINPDTPQVVKGVPGMNLAMGNPSEYYTVDFGPTINGDGKWHHIAGTYDGLGDLSIYVDGVRVSRTVSVTQTAQTFDVFNIGWDDYSSAESDRYLTGSIDDVIIWSRALSPSEVASLVPEPASLALLALSAVLIPRRRQPR